VLRNTLKAERTASRPRHRPRHFFAAVHYEVNIGRKKGAPEVSGNDSRRRGQSILEPREVLVSRKFAPLLCHLDKQIPPGYGIVSSPPAV
jgi:hypothetical protein